MTTTKKEKVAHTTNTKTAATAAAPTQKEVKAQIDALLEKLKVEVDANNKKKIRRALRARGHWGGLGGRGAAKEPAAMLKPAEVAHNGHKAKRSKRARAEKPDLTAAAIEQNEGQGEDEEILEEVEA